MGQFTGSVLWIFGYLAVLAALVWLGIWLVLDKKKVVLGIASLLMAAALHAATVSHLERSAICRAAGLHNCSGEAR